MKCRKCHTETETLVYGECPECYESKEVSEDA